MRRTACVLLVLLASWPAFAQTPEQVYTTRVMQWRVAHEQLLRMDDGWLTVAGLYWLSEGANPVGTSGRDTVIVPADAASGELGTFTVHAGQVSFTMRPGAGVRLNGAPATQTTLKPQDDDLTIGSATLTVITRDGRFGVRVRDTNNPARRQFAGERWYPVDPAYRVVALFVPYAQPKSIQVPNVLGGSYPMQSPGYVEFMLGDRQVRLDALLEQPNARQFFYLFTDATSGRSTYPAGRFLYSDLPRRRRVVLDFNRAFNPPCAFTPYATCPLPPPDDRLPVAIEAGERQGP